MPRPSLGEYTGGCQLSVRSSRSGRPRRKSSTAGRSPPQRAASRVTLLIMPRPCSSRSRMPSNTASTPAQSCSRRSVSSRRKNSQLTPPSVSETQPDSSKRARRREFTTRWPTSASRPSSEARASSTIWRKRSRLSKLTSVSTSRKISSSSALRSAITLPRRNSQAAAGPPPGRAESSTWVCTPPVLLPMRCKSCT